MKITDYIVIEEGSAESLRRRVLSHIADGWLLHGGVSVAVSTETQFSDSTVWCFAQAMVQGKA